MQAITRMIRQIFPARFRSLRYRLPLTYGAISLLVVLVLGLVLQLTLTVFYSAQERQYLMNNAVSIGKVLAPLIEEAPDQLAIQTQFLSFFVRARIEVLNPDGIVLASGDIFDLPVQPYAIAGSTYPVDTSVPSFTIYSVGDGVIGFQVEEGHTLPIPAEPVISDDIIEIQMVPSFLSNDLPADDLIETFVEERSTQVVEFTLDDEQGIVGILRLSGGPAFGARLIEGIMSSWRFASLISVFVACVVGWLVSRDILKPLQSLTRTTHAMAEGNLSTRAIVSREDEFNELAQSFNNMAQRIEDTVGTLRRFISDAAHEINTPITALRTNLDLIQDSGEALERARGQVQRLEQLTHNLLQLSRLESGLMSEELAPLRLDTLIQEVANQYASQADQKELEMALEIADTHLIIHANYEQIRRAISNIVQNAIKFTPAQGVISIRLSKNRGQALLEIEDTGIGIPPEDIPHLFERFYRGRAVARYPGSGLGLAIANTIVTYAGGQILAANTQQGARFTITLPLIDSTQGA